MHANLTNRCLWLALALFAAKAAGCTVIYADDVDKKQCETDADCEGRVDEGAELLCNVKLGVCELPGATRHTCTQNPRLSKRRPQN